MTLVVDRKGPGLAGKRRDRRREWTRGETQEAKAQFSPAGGKGRSCEHAHTVVAWSSG